MEVKEEKAVATECGGIIYYFCSEGCRDKFLKERTCARTAYDLIIIGGAPAGYHPSRIPGSRLFFCAPACQHKITIFPRVRLHSWKGIITLKI